MSAHLSTRRLLKLSIVIAVALAIPIFLAMKPSETTAASGASLLARPYTLPTDVFDLAYFDEYRANGKLDFPRAESSLEKLSDDDLPAAQELFDETAWKAFVALNWPAKPDGEADPAGKFDDTTTKKVWEYWRGTTSIFLADGGKPEDWSVRSTPTLDHFKAGWRAFAVADEGKQAFSGPLVDQNGKWLHYESLVNHREFDFLVENELYNQEGQAVYLKKHGHVEFPENDDAHSGAIEIKFAWKYLTEKEISSNRFLVRRIPVQIYRPQPATEAAKGAVPPAHKSGRTADNNPSSSGDPCTNPSAETDTLKCETVGMVGMHISMRTRSSPQWIWATFEQIDNTRIDLHSGDAKHPLPAKPSLSDPDNSEALVLANVKPPFNADPPSPGAASNDWDETKQGNKNQAIKPVEVLRLVPPPPGTAAVNRIMQEFLGAKGSVLRYYELNGTQWPRHPSAPLMASGVMSAPESIQRKMPGMVVPVYLTNATMETYFQGGNQTAGGLEQDNRPPSSATDPTIVFGTESCAGCHYSAGAVVAFRTDMTGKKIPQYGQNGNGGANGNAGFSWLLQLEAKSKETH